MFNVDVAVKEIIHQNTKKGEHFTVVWNDDTKTTVRLMEGDTSDEYVAFLFALGKKIFENKGNGRQFVRSKKAIFEERMEEQRRKKEEEVDVYYEVEEDIVIPLIISKGIFKKNQ